ncbi:MAG: PEP-CTERM sorting domain-containing protein, partial [Burkholderiales bacterium]
MFGGPDTQRATTEKLVFATDPASGVSASGLLIASFSNLTSGDLNGNLFASATVGSYGGTIGPPIPEPSAYLMMLAGLALMGGVVSARRRTAASA